MDSAKAQLRARMRKRLRLLSPEEKRTESRAVAAHLERGRNLLPPRGGEAGVILGYYPLPSEVNILPFLRTLLQEGYPSALPRIGPEPGEMTFYLITALPGKDPAQGWERSPLGPWEPDKGHPDLSVLPHRGLVLVPGLAFDIRGGRLGRGGGYYDRLLASLPSGWKTAAPLFSCQLVDSVPRASHDIRIQYLVSPRGIQSTAGPNGESAGDAPCT